MQWIGATRWFIMGRSSWKECLVVLGPRSPWASWRSCSMPCPRSRAVPLGPAGWNPSAPVIAYMMRGRALGLVGGLVSVNKFLDKNQVLGPGQGPGTAMHMKRRIS